MFLKEIGINMRNWVDSAQDYRRAVVNAMELIMVDYNGSRSLQI